MENDHPKISCVLITKRKEYPEIILDRLDLGFFDEILIVAESDSVYKRYLAAKKAKNEIIYVQDDDCLVNYQVLFKHFNGLITNTMTKPFQTVYEPTGCTLVGWGCYFNKATLSAFDKYVEKYGVDNHLLREADRIFTYMNRPFNTVIMPHEDLFQDEARMSNDPEHFQSAYDALEKVRVLLGEPSVKS